MGYTHYWTFKPIPKGQAKEVEEKYQLAIRQCSRIVRAYYKANGGLSGFTAHCKLGAYGGLQVNGKGDDAHEYFSLREHYSQNLERGDFGYRNFTFCKTARKPYDIVVVACLLTLKHYLGDLIEISSDGYATDWHDGLHLIQDVLKMNTVKIPKTIKCSRVGCKFCNERMVG